MSKARRDKHKDLVLYQIFAKRLERHQNWNPSAPRWRQSAKSAFEQFLKEFKNE